MTATGSGIRLAVGAPVGLMLAVGLLHPVPAPADGPVVIGADRPAVTVNRAVIDSLPKPPVLPAPLLEPPDVADVAAPDDDATGSRLPPVPKIAGPRNRPSLVFTRRGTDVARVLPPPAIPDRLLSTLSHDSLLPDTDAASAVQPVLPAPTLRAAAGAPRAGATVSARGGSPVAGELAPAIRIEFAVGSALLPDAGPDALERLVPVLGSDPSSRVLVAAYASAPDDSRVRARRLSLSRALAVRSHLISHGIDGLRIDVQARGTAVPDGPADRVDVMVLDQRQ